MPSDPRSLRSRLFPTARRLLLERDVRAVRHRPGDTVLIVGSGHDPYSSGRDDETFFVRTDIEHLAGSVDVVADAHHLPFADASADTLMLVEVLEHLHGPETFFERAHAVLRPGGRLVVTVPYMFHEHGDPYDFYRYSEGGLRHLARRFSQVDVVRQGNRVHCILDLITTARVFGLKPFFPLRLLSVVAVATARAGGRRPSSAPSGFFVVCRK